MAVEVFMAKMSDHMESGEILRWLVQEGDHIEAGQVIFEVMTDKVAAEVVAEASGVIKGIRPGAVEGATVPVGETIAFIAMPGEEVPNLSPLTLAPSPVASQPSPPAQPAFGATPNAAGTDKVRAVPAARRLAKELGVDLAQVTGSGPSGRIRESDVRAFIGAQKAATAPPGKGMRASPVARRVARELGIDITEVPGSGPGGRIREADVRAFAQTVSTAPATPPTEQTAEWLELTPVQRLTGQRMSESAQQAPQFALSITVDMTQALRLRESLLDKIQAETGERLSLTAILVKIVAEALKGHPLANASFDGGRVKLHRQINVGVAVGTDDGLVAPVVREADQKSLAQVVKQLTAYREKAQAMRFTAEDMSGGTFTISNLGMYGVERFRAIINPPQSAILAVGQVVRKPVGMPDDTIALRPMMELTLTLDHRCMDGVQGARFLAAIKDILIRPFFLL
jgi:pyruvate dehydrogenase E2 component (dihydrolipoamide acetyltransferase)